MNTSTISSNSEERMGTAPIFKLMLSMGIPTFVAQLINLLYNIVDRIYIGHIPEVGAASLTGIGLCLPIITLVSAFSVFVGAGGAPLASIALGKGDRDKAQRILSNGVTLLIIFTVIVMAVIYTLKKPLLYFFGASDATYPHADDYLSIYLIGTIFVMITTGLNTFITAQGQSKTAMASVLIGAIFNILLDPIFIFALNLGIKGAAIATVISQAISAAWVIRFLTSDKASLRISAQMMRPQGKLILSIAALGVSPFIMQVTESLITIVFTHGLQKYGDDLYVGSFTILQSIMQIIFIPMSGFSQGVQPIISYNYGKGNVARVKKTCTILITMSIIVSFVLAGAAFLFPSVAAGIFTSDESLKALCAKVLPIYIFGMMFFGIQNGCQQSFISMGQAGKSLIFALLRKVILIIPLAIILPYCTHSVMSIYYAEPISDIVSAFSCGATFLLTFKSMMKGAGKK